MKHPHLMTVGELSRRTGVPIKNLREYTDTGLIYTVGRSPSNYRLYDADALWCVRRIAALQHTLHRIDEFEATHGAELERDSGLCWTGDPQCRPRSA